jgi:iron only hydrogenase large subunit-like protein
MERDKILLKFDELIEEAKQVAEERDKNIKISGESIISPVGYFKLLSSTKALFSYLNTTTYNEMIKEHCTDRVNPGILQGILESAKREFVFGLLAHPRIIATADSMEDFLEQADYLLEQDYKDATCVLVGGVLEATLRSMLENKYPSIEFNPKEGLRKFNEHLHKQASAYDKVTFKLIDGYAELRNLAAHGKYDQYTKDQVKEFILFTRNFISNWFAVRLSVSEI